MGRKNNTSTRRHFLRAVVSGAPLLLGEFSPLRAWAHPEPFPFEKERESAEDNRFWELVRKEFPLTRERIYFNTGGLGPSPNYVLEATLAMMRKVNEISETEHHVLNDIRQRVATFLGCDPEELAFTRNATEGMNVIARGVAQGMHFRAGDEIITTTHEHPGGAQPWLALKNDLGITIRLVDPVLDPRKNMELFLDKITTRTKGIMLSHVTCTLGYKFPVKEICAEAHKRGLFCALDGAQAVGMFPFSLHEIGCDFYTTSGHKWLLGPKGTGLVYISKKARRFFVPTFVGAYSNDQYDLDKLILTYRKSADCTEYGTRNSALVAGLGAAMDFLETIGMKRVAQHGAHLAGYFKSELRTIKGVRILTPASFKTSNSIATFQIDGKNYRDVVTELVKNRKLRVRPVGEHHINAIRVSFHVFNQKKEVDVLLEAVHDMARQ